MGGMSRPLLLSVDWDAYSGTRELVFDAPIWGTRDRPADRLAAWQERARRRGGPAALEADFPLYGGWEHLARYAGVPAFVAVSHEEAWDWLGRFPGHDVLNLDSHHDLASGSGDPGRLRPGNWAGLALAAGRLGRYTALYPPWHAGLPVAEGHDLARTAAEVRPRLSPEVWARVTLARQTHPAGHLPGPGRVASVLLVQSPSWTSPAHDAAFLGLVGALGALPLTP